MVLQKAQVELRMWEALVDLDKLCCAFHFKQAVATQPELVIPGRRGGPRDEDGEGEGPKREKETREQTNQPGERKRFGIMGK